MEQREAIAEIMRVLSAEAARPFSARPAPLAEMAYGLDA
jgi:hypothetical protein